ncbi:MAG: peptidylprolyl isomerase [Deltaproteobacteria bacterium]|nr:peptidylprolyl isomerase [Deltaproteobacteria bacterium]
MRRLTLVVVVALSAIPAFAVAQQAKAPPAAPPAASKEAPKAKEVAKAEASPWTARVRRGETLYATLQTSQGDIAVRLFTKEAPKTVENFVALATGEKAWTDPRTGQKTNKPLYDGPVFHRVIPNFMIQGGDPLGQGVGGPGYEFEDEFASGKKFDKPCILAMANAGPNTNGSQFFITEKPTPWLNNKHTIFGEVVKGCELVAKITGVPKVDSRPKQDVVLKKVVLSEKAP